MALTIPIPTTELANLETNGNGITFALPAPRQSPENFASYETLQHSAIAKIGGATVKYTLEIPTTLEDNVPVVIVPGFCGVRSAYGELRRAIAGSGKPAISLRPVRSRSFPAYIAPKPFQPVDKLPSQAVWGIMRDTTQQYDFEAFDILAHSMGGLVATRLASQKAEYIRSITFVASVGLAGTHNVRTMLARALSSSSEDLVTLAKNLPTLTTAFRSAEALGYVFRNPLRTVREALMVSGCNIQSDIQSLGQLGIKTAALQFSADRYFPLPEVVANSQDIFDIFEVYADPNAGHNAQQSNPKQVAQAYRALAQKLNQTA